MLELRASSLADTHAIAAAVAAVARAGDLIVLSGEMGAGKTAFAQGFGQALGITEPITSPTFTLVHSYDIVAPGHVARARILHHADLYRLDRTAEIADLALDELAEDRGIVLVEWGDVVESMFGDHLVVHLEPDVDDDPSDANEAGTTAEVDEAADEFDTGDLGRLIEISASGPSWAGRWSTIVRGCEAFRC
jgi:tRNA threonylcarbamoyladenosine biosynthesis protein TsaE